MNELPHKIKKKVAGEVCPWIKRVVLKKRKPATFIKKTLKKAFTADTQNYELNFYYQNKTPVIKV